MSKEYDAQGEFIDRERQLPADLNLLADMGQVDAAARAMRAAPSGEPPDDYTVRSVYDSRPVQTVDFLITPDEVEMSNSTEVFFTVPEGRVCVLRRIAHTISNPGTSNMADYRMTIRINDADYPYNVDIPVGFEQTDRVPCFIVVDEFTKVGARIDASVVNGTQMLNVTFYGQFILKSGRPAAFEIANHTGEGKTSTIQNVALEAVPAIRQAPSPVVIVPPTLNQTAVPSSQPSKPKPGGITIAEWNAMSMAEKTRWAMRNIGAVVR